MQLLINEIKGLNAEILKENGLLVNLLQKQMKYNRQKQKKRSIVVGSNGDKTNNDDMSDDDDENSMLATINDESNIGVKATGGRGVLKVPTNRKYTEERASSKPKQRLSQNFKHNTMHSNNKKPSLSYGNSESCIHFRPQWEKQSNRCPSCKSLSKSRKSSSNQTAITHSNIIKSKHQTNMMKLEKLSQKIVPKVSKQWLYKKKSKVFHFE